MPKMCCDTGINEVARFLKLGSNFIEVINFKYPYKVNIFKPIS